MCSTVSMLNDKDVHDYIIVVILLFLVTITMMSMTQPVILYTHTFTIHSCIHYTDC